MTFLIEMSASDTMNTIYISDYHCPVGELILGEYDGKLCMADWKYRKKRSEIDGRVKLKLKAEYQRKETAVLKETKKQLDEYFLSERVKFDLPLLLVGTDFQKRVWNQLQEIPNGQTISYLELSQRLNATKAIRAVASANGANALSIIVPCHRVIGKDKKLTGYAGGLVAKKRLLDIENPNWRGQLNLF